MQGFQNLIGVKLYYPLYKNLQGQKKTLQV